MDVNCPTLLHAKEEPPVPETREIGAPMPVPSEPAPTDATAIVPTAPLHTSSRPRRTRSREDITTAPPPIETDASRPTNPDVDALDSRWHTPSPPRTRPPPLTGRQTNNGYVPGDAVAPLLETLVMPAPTPSIAHTAGVEQSGTVTTLLLGMGVGGAMVFAFLAFIAATAFRRTRRRRVAADESEAEREPSYARLHGVRPSQRITSEL